MIKESILSLGPRGNKSVESCTKFVQFTKLFDESSSSSSRFHEGLSSRGCSGCCSESYSSFSRPSLHEEAAPVMRRHFCCEDGTMKELQNNIQDKIWLWRIVRTFYKRVGWVDKLSAAKCSCKLSTGIRSINCCHIMRIHFRPNQKGMGHSPQSDTESYQKESPRKWLRGSPNEAPYRGHEMCWKCWNTVEILLKSSKDRSNMVNHYQIWSIKYGQIWSNHANWLQMLVIQCRFDLQPTLLNGLGNQSKQIDFACCRTSPDEIQTHVKPLFA